MYCEIAQEDYYDAVQFYNTVKATGFSYDARTVLDAMEKKVVSTVVFAAMAVESFINDYAAACLGDADFYENFDKLSVLSKFELIVRFILRVDLDKGTACYSHMKALMKRRNEFVHNKSIRSEFQGYTFEEIEKINASLKDCEPPEMPLLDQKEAESNLRIARDSLKAIKSMAEYLDENDANVYAMAKLFFPPDVESTEKERTYKAATFALLGIKVSECDEI